MEPNDERDPRKVVAELERAVKRLIKLTVILYTVVAVLLVGVVALGLIAFAEANQTHDALCTYKQDSQQRLDSTRELLDKNPNAFPGVPKSVITQNLRNQQRTLDALRDLNCG